ncbi:PH domain-containing protein [Algoriphagus halophilus]|uniref:PH domain-containing protein n=1 Tax=Algoriphagus halophilus TaxID=226505 RepID=A0A1N6EBI3_9BACT|nr:PH domain-containing protein [Algoriphagus halophilus]SIN80277.1 PH domain-containing protein [Algoriphagus halophilus]
MKFKASLDTLAKGITVFIILLFIYLGQRSFLIIMDSETDTTSFYLHVFILVFLILVLFGTWVFSPQGYEIGDGTLTIKRIIGNVHIRLPEIIEVKELSKEETRGTIRTFGVGGLFGYFGRFYIPKLGRVILFATQRKNKVLIKKKDETQIIITPDNLQFTQYLNQKIS